MTSNPLRLFFKYWSFYNVRGKLTPVVKKAVFISDTHLTPEEQKDFRSFIETLTTAEIFLIGDIFNFWIGKGHEITYKEILEYFETLSKSGTKITFLHGNRDFLVDKLPAFRVAGRTAIFENDNKKIYMEHGDYVLNKNGQYYAYRRFCDTLWVRDGFSLLPFWIKNSIAIFFRFVSKRTTQPYIWKQDEIIKSVKRIIDKTDADIIIMGHIHQPQTVEFDYKGKQRQVIILGDWQFNFAYADLDENKMELNYKSVV